MRRYLLTAVFCFLVCGTVRAADTATVYSVDAVSLSLLKSNPPKLLITAIGQVPSTGWKNARLIPYIYIKPPADGIWDFTFVADRPTGINLPVLTPILATAVIDEIPDWLKGVRIHASTNSLEALLADADKVDATLAGLKKSVSDRAAVKGVSVGIEMKTSNEGGQVCASIVVRIHGKILRRSFDEKLDVGKVCLGVGENCVEFTKESGIFRVKGQVCKEGKELCVTLKGSVKLFGKWYSSGQAKTCVSI